MRRAAAGPVRRVLWVVAGGAFVLLMPGGSGTAAAQEASPSTASEVSVSDFAWLAGTWRGSGPVGTLAEVHYMEPRAGVLPSVFRLVGDGRVVVLELISLVEEDDGLHLYVRHFSPELVPMEEQRAIDLRLVGRDADRFDFENVHEGNPTTGVVHRTGPDAFVSISELLRPDGTRDTIRVEYRRVERVSDAGGR